MRNKRKTKQKELILNYIKLFCNHPTAEEVYDTVKKECPKISLGTVYRNLQNMVDENIIRKFSDENNITRFDGKLEPHNHFICRECRDIIDISDFRNKDVLKSLPADYEVFDYNITYYGLCKNCKKNHSI